MLQKEECIKRYFNMWIKKDGSSLEEIFDDNVVYSECHGPEYRGLRQIVQWFEDWNKRGTVIRWDVKQFIHDINQTVTEWYFECEFDGEIAGFDGVSIIEFDTNCKIINLKEFMSKAEHTFPYGEI